MFSLDKYAENHRSQIIIGRKTPDQIIKHVLDTLPATIVPISSIDPIIVNCFIKTLSNNPMVLSAGIKPDITTCQLIKIHPTTQYTSYFSSTYQWIYVLVEKQTGELDSNCSKLALDLYVYRGISSEDLLEKSMEFTIYINYLKLLNELRESDR